MMKQSTSHKLRQRVSKEDWLNTALNQLKNGGVESIRVERLAKSLNISKSGFYYHFRDRDHLLRSLLDYWTELDEMPASEVDQNPSLGPREKLKLVYDVVERSDLSRLDSAIRQWARQDERVHQVWRKAMQARIKSVKRIFLTAGFSDEEALMRTRTAIAYKASESELSADLESKDRSRLEDQQLDMLFSRSDD